MISSGARLEPARGCGAYDDVNVEARNLLAGRVSATEHDEVIGTPAGESPLGPVECSLSGRSMSPTRGALEGIVADVVQNFCGVIVVLAQRSCLRVGTERWNKQRRADVARLRNVIL
jgi:hypothetical protein